jgi:hypothetical protein
MMGFLDKVTKAVGDVVDKGKKEADQFMRIQRIKGEIGEMEKRIADHQGQIVQAKAKAGEEAIARLRAGTLTMADLQPFADQVIDLEQKIAADQEAIAGKRDDIEQIKAEDDDPKPAAAVAAAPAPAGPPPLPVTAAAAPPPVPAAGGKFCPQCGAKATGGAFCGECGAKLG